MNDEWKGRRVLILGGSCDPGSLLAEKLIRQGAYPLITFRSREGRGKIEAMLGRNSESYDAFRLDLRDPDIPEFEERIAPGLDGLADFAQSDYERLVATADDREVQDYFNANICGRFLLIKRAARQMLRQRSGRMVFISSAAAVCPNNGQGFYMAAKLAAEALYKSIGIEMAQRGVTTLSLRPGYVNSGRARAFIASREKRLRELIPTGSPLTPAELAEAVFFFLSPAARQFNATHITLDGGFSAGKQGLI